MATFGGLAAPRLAWAETPSASAERDPGERAREAFQQGVSAAAHRNFARAVAEFELALQLRPTPSVEYNLAAALYEVERYREAHGHLERVLRAPSVADEVRAGAEALASVLTPHVALLAVDFSAESAPRSSLLLDGHVVDADLWGRPMALEPGGHSVELSGQFGPLAQKEVVVELGRTTAVSLHVIGVPASTEPSSDTANTGRGEHLAAPATSGLPDRDSPKNTVPLRRSWKLWTSVSAAVVVAAGVGLGLALSQRNGNSPTDDGDTLGPGVLTW
ncbi:MAG: hypothetical protein RL385_4466 [Pseudomonadota bacterium]|jgi:hypothetical protein